MLIEVMKRKEGFTANEALLSGYILENIDDFPSYSLRELADKAFVSPPTVSRFCTKLGCKNFSDFKVKLVSEYVERKKQISYIDYNMPINKEESPKQIVNSLSKLFIDALNTAVRDFDYETIDKVAREIEKYKFIDIYASGMSNAVAHVFAEKMTRIGYITTVAAESQKYIRAKQSDKDKVFAIVITYSNETTVAKRCVDYLCEAGVKKLLITGNKYGSSTPKSEYRYYMVSDEQILMNDKQDAFGEIMMLYFILDSLYSIIFQKNYEKNLLKVRETSLYQVKK